ncbi:CGNR zinc finger domain-containing protein [Bacillus sp. V59.32b]|uniref:CGNR zinc finger domain-containing protein n=1 Tax=Bacillus sp. V59.32b TaxID=1758642 RepID=UPI000E3C4163|nr:CGNR zinc finger domain-containing protein [Bacillus sp. V59.32b]RFU62237.1 CGNR zinc finger domain-containing protein [Bacillus sp. V59.32b]
MSHKPAPGDLEIISNLLNTWSIPNETRKATDFLNTKQDLVQFLKMNKISPDIKVDITELKTFRGDIRKAIEEQNGEFILPWLNLYSVKVGLEVENRVPKTVNVPVAENHLISKLLCVVVDAISLSQWNRLKACPDCRYVFYDHSKNGSKKWCGMYAESSEGRACGTIDKVKRYRERNKAKV